MSQIEINKEAIKKFCETYNAGAQFPRTFKELMEADMFRISYLRTICGFACSGCGKGITGPILKFFNYEADCKCYSCQNLNKKYEV